MNGIPPLSILIRGRAACQETVARIQARDHAVEVFVVVATSLISLASAKKEYEFFGVGVGYVALAAAMLSCHHDLIIGHLGFFQHRLCKSDKSGTNWFSKDIFDGVLKARHVRDIYFGIVLGLGAGLGLFISYSHLTDTDHATIEAFIRLCSGLSLVAGLGYIRYAYHEREKLHRKMHPDENCTVSRAGIVAKNVIAYGALALICVVLGFFTGLLGQGSSHNRSQVENELRRITHERLSAVQGSLGAVHSRVLAYDRANVRRN